MARKYSPSEPVNRVDLIEVIGDSRTRKQYKSVGAVLSAGEWRSLGYGAGFGEQSFGFNPAYKIQGDVVHLRGTVLKETGNIAGADNPYGVLPVEARPSSVVYFVARGGGSTLVTGQININGTIQTTTPSGNTSWMALDGVTFSTQPNPE